MKILWFSWRDIKNPLAGGAERVTHNLAKRLTQDGHEVVLLTSGFKGCAPTETINGYRIIRCGGSISVYWQARRHYKRFLSGWADRVIEEINTIPFLTQYYVKNTQRVVLFYQLCRKVWFYQLAFPFSLIGYLLEPIYLWLLRESTVITISESTQDDLIRFGFQPHHIRIISVGIEAASIPNLQDAHKADDPTLLSLGAIRSMKRTLHQISAFEIAKASIPNLQMRIAGKGSGRYFKNVIKRIARSPYNASIRYLGKISDVEKKDLMRKSHIIAVTSVKEGWGLIVTEANSQGTPAVVYNVDGLRDSVRNRQTGLIAERNTPSALAKCIVELLSSPHKYHELRSQGWAWSKTITFDRSYADFLAVINA